jgi:ubiquinone/menaquinone biosynthesis C-methylase UbiE
MTTPADRYLARFFRKLRVPFEGDVLDVGCGDGRVAATLATSVRSVTAIDVEANAGWPALALQTPNLHFSVGDAERLTFDAESFDFVLAMNMLHHAADPAAALGELVRVCKPSGTLVLVEPNARNPIGYVHLTLMHGHHHFTTGKFTRMVRANVGAFELRQFECHLYPIPAFAARVLETLEDAADRIALWHPWIFYNVAVAQRPNGVVRSGV